MTDSPDSPDSAPVRAFEDHEAFETVPDATEPAYRVTTTAFEGTVFLPEEATEDAAYSLVVRTPTLEAATADEVGPAVAVGWFDTFKRRLGDAPTATRHDVSLSAFGVAEDGSGPIDEGEVVIRYEFTESNPKIASQVTKTFAEYVEGTYVEGIVPGYDYRGAVADLLGRAASQGSLEDGEGDEHRGSTGGTPL